VCCCGLESWLQNSINKCMGSSTQFIIMCCPYKIDHPCPKNIHTVSTPLYMWKHHNFQKICSFLQQKVLTSVERPPLLSVVLLLDCEKLLQTAPCSLAWKRFLFRKMLSICVGKARWTLGTEHFNNKWFKQEEAELNNFAFKSYRLYKFTKII